MTWLKWKIKKILESHPYGYFVGNKIVSTFFFSLPHEEDFYGLQQLARQKKSSGLFLDVGANDGKSVRSFTKLVNNWNIVSVEANPVHQKKLERLKKSLPHFDYHLGAADEIGNRPVSIFIPVYNGIKIHSAASTTLYQAQKTMERFFKKPRIVQRVVYFEVQCQTLTLDSLGLKPDLVKIDIEGKEEQALKGFIETLEACSPDLLIEYNPENFTAVSTFLSTRGYFLFGFDVQRRVFRPFKENAFRNCFFSKKKLTQMDNNLPTPSSFQ